MAEIEIVRKSLTATWKGKGLNDRKRIDRRTKALSFLA
jgi:hypothetical protein